MIDLVIIVGYFTMMLFVGWHSRRQSAESYWVAERRYGSGRVTASLVATIFGASSTMGIIGLGYSRGLTGAWWSLVGGMALIPFGLLLAGRIRALKVYTLPDILKRAYGVKVAVAAGVIIAISWCGIIAAQLVAGARLLGGVFSLDFQLALAIVAVVFVIYTFWGGQLSVIRTDSWQLVLFVGGLVVSLVFLFCSQGVGASLSQNIPEEHLRFPVSAHFGWYEVLVFYPLVVGLPYLVGPDIYTRVLCAKSNEVAQRSALLAAAAVVPLSFLLALFGLLAVSRFPGIAPEAALPQTLTLLVPVGLKGLIMAGFLGAIMSSADTCLMSVSTILSLNVISPIRQLSTDQYLKGTKVVIVVVGAGAWLIASQEEGIISSLLLGYTVFVGGVAIPTLTSFCKDTIKVTSGGAFWAIATGGTTAVLGKINGGTPMKGMLSEAGNVFLQALLGPQYLSILPILVSLAVLLVMSWIARTRD
jgi:SSS family solute:Na+ symporter